MIASQRCGPTRGSVIWSDAWVCRRTRVTRLSLITVLACTVPSYGHAQDSGVVSGTVSESGGRPLRAVMVSVQGLGISTATGASGQYILTHVPAGAQLLELRKSGYTSRQMTITVTPGAREIADAVMGREPLELGAVVVEGVSRAPDRMIEAPAALTLVRPVGAAQAPLALTHVPGLDVAQGGVTDFNVNARGFNGMLTRKLLVLQDGRDLGTAVIGSQIWGTLSEPLEDLGSIEVIRGPGSALYGANAYNGVINITTPSARDVIGTKLTLGGGELGTERADLRHAGETFGGRVGYRVNVGYTRSADWARSRTNKDSADLRREYAPAGETAPLLKPDSLPLIGQTKDPLTGRAFGTPDPVTSIYGSARVDYYAAGGAEITLEGGAARLDNSVFIGGSDRNQAPRILRPWARVAWTGNESGLSAWYSGASFAALTLSNAKGVDNYESAYHAEGRTRRRFGGDRGRVVVGASIQNNKVDSRGTVLGRVNDDRSDQYYGAFAQVEYGVGRLRVIGALRWDGSDLFRAQLSPKGALVFTPARNHALRFTIDRAFLAPSLLSVFARRFQGVLNLMPVETKLRNDPVVGPALSGVAVGKLFDNSLQVPESSFGNPRVVPQTMTSYELGYKGQLGRRVFLTIDLYDARIPNFATGLLPAGATRLNPAYQPWTAPAEVVAGSRSLVDSAVFAALAPFPKNIRNGLTRLGDGTTAIVQSYGNVGVVDEWGIELGSSVSLARSLTLTAGYTWYNWAIRHNLVDNVVASNTPHNRGSVALAYTGYRLDLEVGARLVSRYHWTTGSWDGDVPASRTMDLDGGFRVAPHLRLYVSGTDIFNERRFQVFGGSVIGRRVLTGLTTTF
jgi:outer membrane receptor for ferrienterochelin and colicins